MRLFVSIIHAGVPLVALFALSVQAFAQLPTTTPDTVTVVTTYEYDAFNQVTAVEVVSSDGARRRTETTYAYEDFPDMGVAGTHQLTSVSARVVRNSVGALPLECSRMAYQSPSSVPVFMPWKMYSGCDDEDEEEMVLTFLEFDAHGRVLAAEAATGLRVEIDYEGRHIEGITRSFRRYFSSTNYYDVDLEQSFGYDNLGRLTLATDENGTTLHYSYDGSGRLLAVERSYVGGLFGGLPVTLMEHDYYLSAAENGGTYDPVFPNFVRTLIFAGGGSPAEEATGYFDGLGRELQSQQVVDADTVAVSFPEYDALGRPHRQWRPVGMLASAGALGGHGFIPITSVRTAALAFYEGMPGNEDPGDFSIHLNRPYTQTWYEDSPLSRETEMQAPGMAADATYSGSGHAVDYVYGVAQPRWNGSSQAQPMSYTEARDADDRWTRTYTDGLGRERFVSRGMGTAQESLTELIYDAADRLLEVRPPHFFAPPTASSAGDWITEYEYDTRGQLLWKTTPDTRNTTENGPGQHRYIYDDHGRLRYSQDPEQRAQGVVAFTRYDRMGRVTDTGIGQPLVCDTDPEGCWSALDPHGGAIPDVRNPTGAHWENQSSNWRTLFHYDDATQTLDVDETLVTRVEHWPFFGDSSFEYTNTAGRLVAVAHRTEGLWQSGSSPRWQATHFAYDEAGNVTERWTYTQGAAHEWERFTYSYDRQGRPTSDAVEVGPYELHHFYEYDRRGLLTEVRASTDGTVPTEADLVLEYGIDGAVIKRHLGNGAANVTYLHDVAGRLVEIGNVETSVGHFAARYHYSPGGLISEIETRSPAAVAECGTVGYECADRWRQTFAYDPLARLTGANYAGYDVNNEDYYWQASFDLFMSYDRQGNIKGLVRTAPEGGVPVTIDELLYEYRAGTNRLIEVEDFASENGLDWDAKPTTFVYDRNGNAVSITEELPDNETRTTAITRYDERNLPERLNIVQPGQHLFVHYTYDLSGQRIRKYTHSGLIILPPGGGDPPPDTHYAVERYVRDGQRLVGTFDGDGNLISWNLGGAAGLIGRLEYGMTTVFDDSLAVATAEEWLEDSIHGHIVAAFLELNFSEPDADSLAALAAPVIKSIAVAAVPAAVAAAIEHGMERDPAGSTHYGLTIDDTVDALWDALEYLRLDPLPARDAGPAVASANAQEVSNAVAASYVEVPGEDLTARYYIADHLGSIRAVVNEQGDVLEARDYYPYGLMMPGRVFVQGQQTREGYTGHELDNETGHYYAGARFYNPALARWAVVDPLAEVYAGWSPYNYVMGNPLSLIDPDGRSAYRVPDDFKNRNNADYFSASTGDFLGSTGNSGPAQVRIIDDDVWNSSGSDSAAEIREKSASAWGDDLSQSSVEKIYTHYFSAMGYDTSQLQGGRIHTTEPNGAPLSSQRLAAVWGPQHGIPEGLVRMAIRQGALGRTLYNTFDIMSIIRHENHHAAMFMAGHRFTSATRNSWERVATLAQINHYTWSQTSHVFKAIMFDAYGGALHDDEQAQFFFRYGIPRRHPRP